VQVWQSGGTFGAGSEEWAGVVAASAGADATISDSSAEDVSDATTREVSPKTSGKRPSKTDVHKTWWRARMEFPFVTTSKRWRHHGMNLTSGPFALPWLLSDIGRGES
jgi:hypothetical protein